MHVMMSSSQCIVPKWNLRQQRQEEEGEGEERKRSSHVQSNQNLTNYVVPMCEDEVRELRWEKGQVGVHGMSELNHRWGGGGDHTLESIVHQATSSSKSQHQNQQQSVINNSMGVKCMDENSQQVQVSKRVRSDGGGFPAEESRSRSQSGSATFFRERDADQMTWNSFDSSRSLKTARTHDHHSLYHHYRENEDGGTAKEESCRSESSARRSRAAAIHNLSERRRRDRINEKMKALQKLVPNASKTDKASMLEEVIEYLKQLQAQVQMMSNASRNMVMQPLGMQAQQQQLQMSLMAARMGMGMGMGIPPPLLNPPFLPQPFSLKPMVDAHAAAAAAAISNDAYNAFLAQSMNMEFLNKMSALYKQQSSSSQQPSVKPIGLSLPNHDAQGC